MRMKGARAQSRLRGEAIKSREKKRRGSMRSQTLSANTSIDAEREREREKRSKERYVLNRFKLVF